MNFKWELDKHGWIISSTPKEADGPIYGFGKTKEDALIDYIKAYNQLIDLAYDCYSPEWKHQHGKVTIWSELEKEYIDVDLTKHGNIVDKLTEGAINDLNSEYRRKMKSFIKLCRRGCVSDVNLTEYYGDFHNSNFDDAYEYFCSKGMIQTEQISTMDIIKYINRAMRDMGICYEGGYEGKHIAIVGRVMKLSGGKLDPYRVKDIVEEYLEVAYK
jgi:hypothetical protein